MRQPIVQPRAQARNKANCGSTSDHTVFLSVEPRELGRKQLTYGSDVSI